MLTGITYGQPLTLQRAPVILRAMTEWAHRIRRLEAAGWSLTDLAKTLGIAVSTVSDIKTGRTLEPKGMAAVRLFGLAADVPDAEGDGAAEAAAPDSAEQRAA